MRVILEVTSGPSMGRHIRLQDGEIARFGRSHMADVCFPDDIEMSEVHFELACQGDRCLVRDLQSASGTLLNEQPLVEANLRAGDIIKAGQTSLLTSIKGESVVNNNDTVQAQENSSQLQKKSPSVNSRTLAELCALLELEEDSLLLEHKQTLASFVELLDKHKRFSDAIRVLSFCLPKPQAVLWAHSCVQELWGETFSEKEKVALEAALRWGQEPTEGNRRLASAAAEEAEFQSAASWVAIAAFWSEGSIAPPDLPVVAPDERLTSQGVSAALIMTATRGDVKRSEENFQSIVNAGRALLNAQPQPSLA